MDNRYRNRDRQQEAGGLWGNRDRQSEQFSGGGNDQYGDSGRSYQGGGSSGGGWSSGGDYDRSSSSSQGYRGSEFSRPNTGYGYESDSSALDAYESFGSSGASYGSRSDYGQSRQNAPRGGHDRGGSGGYGYERSQGAGRDRYGAMGYGNYSGSYGGYGSQDRSQQGRGAPHIPARQFDPDDRGFFERASDEVMSWFGDEDAARRRRMDSQENHSGRGPANYARSGERILEDVNERLTRDPHLDASKITVTCKDNEITLDGTVDSRSAKRRAEDIADDVSGVKHVQNNLRVEARESYYGATGTAQAGKSAAES